MNINTLINMSNQGARKELYSNGDATITSSAKIDPEFQAQTTASAIYHRSEDYSFPKMGGENNIEVYATRSTADEDHAKLAEMTELLTYVLGKNSTNLRHSYEAAVSKLPPQLREKDWGFSIADGSLIFMAGSDPLSEHDLAALNDAFSGSAVEYHAEQVASTITRALQLERGADGVSRGIGQFDVTKENFGDIVDLRAYLLSHGPDGKYGRNFNYPNNDERLYRITGGFAMMDQISARAVPRFVKE